VVSRRVHRVLFCNRHSVCLGGWKRALWYLYVAYLVVPKYVGRSVSCIVIYVYMCSVYRSYVRNDMVLCLMCCCCVYVVFVFVVCGSRCVGCVCCARLVLGFVCPYSSVVEHPLSKRKVGSSILLGGISLCYTHHVRLVFNTKRPALF
jgi:hypothetical protein